jgi:hypothetical protein
MQHLIRRSGMALGVSALLIGVGATPALAHECFVANRSTQGDLKAGTNSQAWETVSLKTVVSVFLGQTAEVAQCVDGEADSLGIPHSFVFGIKQAAGQDGVIAEKNPNMQAKGLAGDGKGIDHAEAVYGDTVVTAIFQCGGGFDEPV